MLITAAAQKLNVDARELTAQRSRIVHRSSGRSLSFGELAHDAAALKRCRPARHSRRPTTSPSGGPLFRASTFHRR